MVVINNIAIFLKNTICGINKNTAVNNVVIDPETIEIAIVNNEYLILLYLLLLLHSKYAFAKCTV